jgi:thiamine-monophosphate kinase
MVLRSGARPGDRVFVTGAIGDSALGLAALQGQIELPAADASFLARRYRLPDPRTALAPALCAHASAALDISDGLAADFGHLCRASGVAGSITFARLPLSPAAANALRSRPDLRTAIVSGGDDYEILLTAPPTETMALLACGARVGVELSEIGTIAAGEGIAVVLDLDGAPMKLAQTGWTHA